MIRCGMLDLEILPDGTGRNVECNNIAALTFLDPRCPTCLKCYGEVFQNGHVGDLGGVAELRWNYFKTSAFCLQQD